MTNVEIKQFLPGEVPDHLFTQSRLRKMGLVTIQEHVAFVLYPEQKREYKLFDINATRIRKTQEGFTLVEKDHTVDQILHQRKHELEFRKRSGFKNYN